MTLSFLDRIIKEAQQKKNTSANIQHSSGKVLDALVSSKVTDIERMVAVPEADHFEAGDLTDSLMRPGLSRVWTNTKGIKVTGLNKIQSAALAAIRDSNGGIFPIAVGGGKAYTALLAGTVLNAHPVILTPARTVHQMFTSYADLRPRFRIPDTTEIISYSKLSTQTDILRRLCEKHERVVIVADECHKLANFTAARTKRLLRFFENDRPDAMFVGLSGTLTSKSIKQMAHLVELALGNNAPVPLLEDVLESLAECLDVKGKASHLDWQRIAALWNKYYREDMMSTPIDQRVEKARRAFQTKLHATKGVVATTDASVSCSLVIDGFNVPVPADVQSMINNVADSGENPDGEILPDEASRWRAARHLSVGFYYVWQWPDGVVDWDWMDARSDWNSHVRYELEHNHAEGYDSPLFVWNRTEHEIKRKGGATTAMEMAMLRWKEQKKKRWFGQPQPPVEPVWVSDFYLNWFKDFVGKHKQPWIIWYESSAARAKLEEMGLLVYGASSNVDTDLRKTCAMSMKAQGTGLDLQTTWSRNIFFEPPSSGSLCEQVLGRTHRHGQVDDEVLALMPQHTESFRNSLQKAVKEAYYQWQTSGNRTKLTFADFTDQVDLGDLK